MDVKDMKQAESLKGKAAVITGATRGIGRAIAERMAKAGIKLVVNGTTAEGVAETLDALRRLGAEAAGVVGRVEEMATGRQMVQTALDHFGRIDYLINNAGIVADRMSHRMNEAEWDRVLAVHAKGVFASTQPFLQAVREAGHGGVIVNMTSLAGLTGTVGQLNYAAAKGAIVAMTYTLAAEWETAGIRVHAVAPAALTDMTRPHVERARREAAERGEELSAYWQIGQPEDVAAFVCWLLAHPEESGTVWGVNGKQVVRWEKPVATEWPLPVEELERF